MENKNTFVLKVLAHVLLIGTALAATLSSHAQAAQPVNLMNNFAFQGYLSGVADGTYTMNFVIKKATTANVAIGTDKTMSVTNVQVSAGVFSVILDGVSPSDFSHTGLGKLTMDVVVNPATAGEINFPGVPIASVPSALVAQLSVNAQMADSLIATYKLPITQLANGTADGQIPKWIGGAWTLGTDNTGGGTITAFAGDVSATISSGIATTSLTQIQGKPVNAPSPAANQVLTYNGSQWAPATPTALGTDSVTTTNILNASITTPKLADGSVTLLKLNASGSTMGQVLGSTGSTITWLPVPILEGGNNNGASSVNIGNNASGQNLYFRSGNATHMVLDAAGNLAINATGTSPTATLDVIGTLKLQVGSPATGKVLIASDANGNATWGSPSEIAATSGNANVSSTSGNVELKTNSLPRLVVANTSGNVSIGTASGGATLEVDSTAVGQPGLIVKAISSQTANLQEWKDSAGVVQASVATNGSIKTNSGLAVGASGNIISSIKMFSATLTGGMITGNSSVDTTLGSASTGAYVACNLISTAAIPASVSWSCYINSGSLIGRISCLGTTSCTGLSGLVIHATVFEP